MGHGVVQRFVMEGRRRLSRLASQPLVRLECLSRYGEKEYLSGFLCTLRKQIPGLGQVGFHLRILSGSAWTWVYRPRHPGTCPGKGNPPPSPKSWNQLNSNLVCSLPSSRVRAEQQPCQPDEASKRSCVAGLDSFDRGNGEI